ncbi:hypothetical protein ACFX4N_23980 [Priestia sp. YIM B13551]|uniref:hypothetical protein n=1 Tax=Priestia sp. YIM B13551 TaxID=3366306 RepID=UPI00366B77D0
MASPSTTIFMGPENVTVTVVNEQGITSVKETNVETLQEVFMKEQAMETPLLPSQWGVVKYYRKNHYEGYVLTTPPMEREVTFSMGNTGGIPQRMTIPVPPLLWIFEVLTNDNSKRLTHSMMYVLKHELLSVKDKVLHAPYPNIGVSHGICWGRDFPQVPTSKSIQNMPSRFFSQAFNYDLSSNRVKEFEWNRSDGETTQTENAVHHMVHTKQLLEKSREDGETFVYPFDTLKEAGTLNVERAIRNYLPGIFN